MKRIPILYVIFAVLVLVSVAPLLIYGFKVMAINREALETNERELQNTITGSLAAEIALYDSSIRQQLKTLAKTLEPSDAKVPAWDSAYARTTLEHFVASNENLLYVTLLDEQARGIRAGNYNASDDPFLRKSLERAFTAAQQNQEMNSEPIMVTRNGMHAPAMTVSLPLLSDRQFRGMLAAIVDLQPLVNRLKDYSARRLEPFVVNYEGRLMLHPDLPRHSIGQDVSGLEIVRNMRRDSRGEAPVRATMSYTIWVEHLAVPMLGTYFSVPQLRWAVIAQKRESDAYISVRLMEEATRFWGAVALIISLLVAYVSALRVTTPINILADSSRAIARGDFSQRIHLRSRTEIGELANTFNQMTGELERYVGELKQAAEENHELFLSSIQMIAAAVDEKDPYTHGHSERVTKYSVLVARHMGLTEDEIYKVKISALLHDVGKIGIDDRILKKPGALTPEEFEVMKTHTTKGANILKPIQKLQEMIPGVELHHESLDGRGYPHGFKADEIPLLPRIIAVADTFDAMTTHRPYQQAMEPEVALKYIHSKADIKFDSRCANGLQAAFDAGELHLTRTAIVV